MEQRYATSPEHVPGMDTAELRQRYLIQDLFVDDEVKALYSHHDRIVLVGVSPVTKALTLETFPQIRSDFFFEHREGGIVNVGGTGTVTVDGTAYLLTKGSCLYIGLGARVVAMASAGCAGGRHSHDARAESDVQARALGEQVRGAVNRDRSGAADVDDPTLAVLEEEVAADLREGLQGEGLGDGADTHEHDAVVVGVERLDLVVNEQVLDQVALAELCGVHPGYVLWARGVTLFHEDPLPSGRRVVRGRFRESERDAGQVPCRVEAGLPPGTEVRNLGYCASSSHSRSRSTVSGAKR